MVARNQPRKRFDLMCMAFAKWVKDKPDNVKLYLHTGLEDIGFDILNLVQQTGLDGRLILTPDITPNQGVTDMELNYIYNSFDVNALISLGDGFGLPVAETMAVGCPQIVSGHSCLKELVEDHGGLIVKNAAWVLNSGGMNTWGGVSDVDDLVKQLDFMYQNPAKRIQMGEDAYRFITQEQFTWDYAARRFNDIFSKVYHLVGGRNEYNLQLANPNAA
jgi:glycosyltransferase involved in cell wall biosynthesis